MSARGRAEVPGGAHPPQPLDTADVPTRPEMASPDERLTRLRRQARTAGFSINSRSDPRGEDGRRYSLVDRATKTVVAGRIPDLDALAAELLTRIRERSDQGHSGANADLSLRSCPDCGTRRIGAFRYCRSCGRDFEPDSPSAQVPAIPAANAPVSLDDPEGVAASAEGSPEVDPPADLSPAGVRPDDLRVGDGPMTVTPSDPESQMVSVSITMLLVIGLGIGIGVGALVAVLLGAVLR